MSDRNNDGSSLQGVFAQVLREIQSGISKLEQTVNQAVQNPPAGRPGNGEGPATPETPSQSQSAPKPPTEPYKGQKFEYKVVYVNFRGQISSEGDQTMIGRGERRSSFVREYLDELGQEGWELTGVSPLAETENSYFIFKRPATREWPAPTSTSRSGQRVPVEEVDESAGTIAQL